LSAAGRLLPEPEAGLGPMIEIGREFLRRGWLSQAASFLGPPAASGALSGLAELRCALAEALLGLAQPEAARTQLELALAEDVRSAPAWRLLSAASPRSRHARSASSAGGSPCSLA